MKKFAEYENDFPEIEVVEKKYVFYAYKQGKCETFDTREEAKTYSSNVESVVANKSEFDAYKQAVKSRSLAIYDAWFADLRNSYSVFVEWDVFMAIFRYLRDETNVEYDDMKYHFDSLLPILNKVARLAAEKEHELSKRTN